MEQEIQKGLAKALSRDPQTIRVQLTPVPGANYSEIMIEFVDDPPPPDQVASFLATFRPKPPIAWLFYGSILLTLILALGFRSLLGAGVGILGAWFFLPRRCQNCGEFHRR